MRKSDPSAARNPYLAPFVLDIPGVKKTDRMVPPDRFGLARDGECAKTKRVVPADGFGCNPHPYPVTRNP